jgi:hypothetical protein
LDGVWYRHVEDKVLLNVVRKKHFFEHATKTVRLYVERQQRFTFRGPIARKKIPEGQQNLASGRIVRDDQSAVKIANIGFHTKAAIYCVK